MHPRALAALVRDPDAMAAGLIALRRLLPGADVSRIVCAQAQVLEADLDKVRFEKRNASLECSTMLSSSREVQALAGVQRLLRIDADQVPRLAERETRVLRRWACVFAYSVGGMQEVAEVQRLLRIDAHQLSRLAEREPRLLDSALVSEALAELERLMPRGTNARAMLRNDLSILLSTQRGRNRIGAPPDDEPDSSYLEPFSPPVARAQAEAARGAASGAQESGAGGGAAAGDAAGRSGAAGEQGDSTDTDLGFGI
jgi:hypothetical protein